LTLNLLRVVRSLDPACGGPVEGIRQISPHLAALGVQTSVVTLDPPDVPWLADQPFEVIPLGPVFGNYGYRPGLPKLIYDYAQQNDCVIVHDLWQYNAFATWRALRGTGIPYYVYTHGMLDPWFKYNYPLKHLKKWAYWPWANYRVLRDASAVLFTTDQERLLARDSFWLYDVNECVVGYGTSSPPYEPDKQQQVFLDRFPDLRDKRIILFLSRIHPKKGVDLLIEAFARVYMLDSRLRLVIAGPDSVGWQASLQQQSISLGVDQFITWTGMLRDDLKWGSFRCAEVFCLPSHQENFGIVVAEALACGLPVAISHPVNISSEIAIAQSGIVFPDTLEGVYQALIRWLDLSTQDKQVLSVNAYQLFHSRYDYKTIAAKLIPILRGN
jgi:glycosyltransferase involved in cell wall biosynthesis